MKVFVKMTIAALVIVFLLAGCSKEKEISIEQLTQNALNELNNGQIAEARKTIEKTINRIGKELGQEDPSMLKPLLVKALIVQSQKESSEAESVYKEAIDIAGKAHGDESSEIAMIMNNLAALYFSQKEYDKALKIYEQTLAVVQKLFPENDPRIITIQNNINAVKGLQAGETESPRELASNQEIPDLVPAQLKKVALERLANQNIMLFDLRPMQPVQIFGKGAVFPYRCMQKKSETDEGKIEVVLLFAAVENPEKKGAYIFQNSRLVSYDSYQADLEKGGLQFLRKALIEAFPGLYSSTGGSLFNLS